jgi:hypothetical protein
MALTNEEYIKLHIGEYFDQTLLTDTVIEYITDSYSSLDDGAIIYFGIIDCLEFMLAAYTKDGGNRREKEGDLEVEEDTSSKIDGIYDLLAYYKAHPPRITGISPALPCLGGMTSSSPLKVKARTRNAGRRRGRRSYDSYSVLTEDDED